MKKMEQCPEKAVAVANLIERIERSGLDSAAIARLARISDLAVRYARGGKSIPRWATIDKINRGLNRWEAKAKE